MGGCSIFLSETLVRFLLVKSVVGLFVCVVGLKKVVVLFCVLDLLFGFGVSDGKKSEDFSRGFSWVGFLTRGRTSSRPP